jgi:hypothetical protein
VSLKGLARELHTGERCDFILPHSEERDELAEENEQMLSHMIVLHALSESKLIERNFDQWRRSLTNKLFGSFPLKTKVSNFLELPGLVLDPSE